MHIGVISDDTIRNRLGLDTKAAFCHKVDVHSARIWYDYPKPAGIDEWIGANRVRTIK